MIKAELAAKIAEKTEITKVKAMEIVDATIESLIEALKAGDEIRFLGFGSFKVVNRAARKSRNPRTGETINLPASKQVKFKVSKALKV